MERPAGKSHATLDGLCDIPKIGKSYLNIAAGNA
jgi:hypothetical protein